MPSRWFDNRLDGSCRYAVVNRWRDKGDILLAENDVGDSRIWLARIETDVDLPLHVCHQHLLDHHLASLVPEAAESLDDRCVSHGVAVCAMPEDQSLCVRTLLWQVYEDLVINDHDVRRAQHDRALEVATRYFPSCLNFELVRTAVEGFATHDGLSSGPRYPPKSDNRLSKEMATCKQLPYRAHGVPAPPH